MEPDHDQHALPVAPSLGALWQHRALVAAALYTFVALVGALYYALLLGEFRQNAFHYWEASDFLLAAFREPIALGFGLAAIGLYLSFTQGRAMNDLVYGRVGWIRRLVRYDRWRESPLMGLKLGPILSIVLTLVWFVVVMGSIAAGAAGQARRGEGPTVRYALEGAPLEQAQLVTTTNRFLFLLRPGPTPAEGRLLVVPIDSLALLDLCGARRGGIRALVRGPEECATVVPAVMPAATPATAASTPASVPAAAPASLPAAAPATAKPAP